MRTRLLSPTVLGAAVLVLAGCAVGPQYVRPDPPVIALASPQATQFAADTDEATSADWWTFFEDEGLTRQIEAALQHNHDIRQAQAHLLAARAVFDQRRLDRLPGVTGSAGYKRGIEQQPDAQGRPVRTLSESWRAGLDVQWEIDLFGRLDRLQHAAAARAQASQAEADMTRLSIAAEVARAWFELQGAHRQLTVTRGEIDNWRETARVAEAQAKVGTGMPEDLENARANLLRSEATIPALTASLQQARYRLDVLQGQRPGQGGAEPAAEPTTLLVTRLPLGNVDRLIRNRPDVVQAERLLAASVEDVGASTAELYPRVDLGGFLGFLALRGGDFGSGASRAFEVAPTLSWPAFRLAYTRARVRAAEASSEGAAARYEQVVLTAQEEVENAVTQMAEQQRALTALLQSAHHAQTAFEIADKRYRAGAGSYLAVLENQRALFQLRQQITRADTASRTQVAVLYKALGWGMTSQVPEAGMSASKK